MSRRICQAIEEYHAEKGQLHADSSVLVYYVIYDCYNILSYGWYTKLTFVMYCAGEWMTCYRYFPTLFFGLVCHNWYLNVQSWTSSSRKGRENCLVIIDHCSFVVT